MNATQIHRIQRVSFWIAALFHILLFMIFSYLWVYQKPIIEQTEPFIPSYAYHESAAAAHEEKPIVKEEVKKPKPKVETSIHGTEKPIFEKRDIKFNQIVDISSKKSSEPVHLIGDNSKTPQPLIIILGKALTAQLLYPKIATDLTIRGVSVIGFVLHPDGVVTEVRLLKSSGAEVLDQAALSAASSITPVKNVAPYVKEPMPIVFGIIFGSPR